jgi:two-component system chemotaxis sensor kinase CheA
MQTQDDFLRQLREIFSIEAEEHLKELQDGILALEKDLVSEAVISPTSSQVQTIYRAAHSLKGASRAVDFLEIESLCHSIENIFSSFQKGESTLTTPVFDILNNSLDYIARLLHGEKASAQTIKDLVSELEHSLRPQKTKHSALFAQRSEPKPESSPPDFKDQATVDSCLSIPSQTGVGGDSLFKQSTPTTVRIKVENLQKILNSAEELIPLKLALTRNTAELRDIVSFLEAWLKEERSLSSVNFQEVLKPLSKLVRKEEEDLRRFRALSDDILHNSQRSMMLPCSHIAAGFSKMVRDLSHSLGKDVDFSMEGEQIEFEKSILEKIKNPLIHVIRNCVDHGIESPSARIIAGKPGKGHIRLSIAPLDGGLVEFSLVDDGSGIDIQRIKKVAQESGSFPLGELEKLNDAELIKRIFLPGVSTSTEVTEVSGRGMGLAIVQNTIEEIGGHIDVETQPGKGTTFKLVIPTSRATFNGVIIRLGWNKFIIPTKNIVHALRISQRDIFKIEGNESIKIGNDPFPLVHLGDVLGLPRTIQPNTPLFIHVILVEALSKRIAFLVDEVLEEHEVLVKPFGPLLPKLRNIIGAAIVGSGDVIPVLDPNNLLRNSISLGPKHGYATQEKRILAKKNQKKSILIVEDSITSRMLLKSILESAGYKVSVANDGMEGLTALKTEPFDLVLSDIEMPRMDGFTLTEQIRANPQLSRLPVILVTSLETKEYREKGASAGANAYITKSNFAQANFLEIIQRFI